VSLTSRGKELQKTSTLYFDLKDEIGRFMETKTEKSKMAAARILVTDEVERPFVAEVVAKIAKKLKGKMEIFSVSDEEVSSLTGSGENDILLSHERVPLSWNHIRVDFPVFFVTSSSIPKLPTFDNPGNIQKVLDYFSEDLIVPAPNMTLGKEFAGFRRKHGFRREVQLESNIVSCLVRFVASGTGCSFLPLPYIKSSLYENHIHLIGPRDGYWKHSIYIYANLPKKELETHPLVKTIRLYGSLD
jgi:LysR family transcriptional activator of nhaA